MKKYLKALCMCFSMFCAVPTPFMHVWDESVRGIMLTMFPLVGAFIGAIWALIGLGLRSCGVPDMLFAALMTIAPFILTGGIHLDGYMDCCDGIFSRRDLERRREILKDSHVGSFAVVGLGILLLMFFGAFGSLKSGISFWPLVFIATASRANSGLGITYLKPMSHSEYAGDFHKSINGTNAAFLIGFLLLSAVLGFVFCGLSGLIPVIATTAGYWLATLYAYRQFEGFSGDVTGFGHTIGELCGVITMIFI